MAAFLLLYIEDRGACRKCQRPGNGFKAWKFQRKKGKIVKTQLNGQGLARLLKATQCTIKGLRAAWDNEAAFRQEALGALVLLPLGLWLGDSGVDRALRGGSVLLLLLVELLNSAIEAVVDRIGPEWHELSGRAKDMGSAAVACAMALLCLVWLCVLL